MPPSTAQSALAAAHRALQSLLADTASIARIETVAALLAERFAAGNKVLICGNGGSACDAMHFAEELTGRFRKDRQPLPALACADPGHITCTANDYGFEEVFARWIRALGKPGDVLILLSTSGNSENVLRAAAAGKELDLHTVSLLGRDGGKLRGLCAHEWIVGEPSSEADRIQELHMLILHTIIECVEARLSCH